MGVGVVERQWQQGGEKGCIVEGVEVGDKKSEGCCAGEMKRDEGKAGSVGMGHLLLRDGPGLR